MTCRQSELPNYLIKRVAKAKLKGHWGCFIGAFFLSLAFEYVLTSLIELPIQFLQTKLMTQALISGADFDPLSVYLDFPWAFIYLLISSVLVGMFMGIITGGGYRMYLENTEDRPVRFSQLFFGFKNKPGRYIAATLLTTLMTSAPVLIYVPFFTIGALKGDEGRLAPAEPILILICTLALVYAVITMSLALAMVPLVLTDHPEISGGEAVKISIRIMAGNKFKLFGLMFSFFGWFVLAMLTLGGLMAYVAPYYYQSITIFYKDATGQINVNCGEPKEYTDYTQYRGEENNDSGE